jgi:hypothetical protein
MHNASCTTAAEHHGFDAASERDPSNDHPEGVLPSHVLRIRGGKLGLTDDIERRTGKIRESLLRTMLDDGDGGICGGFCAPEESF